MIDKRTTELDNILNYIESEDELKDYLAMTLSQETLSFIYYLVTLRLAKNLKKSVWIEQSDIHRTDAYQILNGTKTPSRDNILKLCLGGGFNLEETNRVLTLEGYNKLYAKDRRDSLLIFCINKGSNLLHTNLFLDKFNQDPLGSID